MTRRFSALGTTVSVVTAEADASAVAAAAVAAELSAFDVACSRFRDDSELTRVNSARGAAVRVGPILFDALQVAVAAARHTGGLVDPTVGRTLRLAGYDRTFRIVAARDPRTFTASFCTTSGWQTIELDERAMTVRVPSGVELDLGATGKALAADRAARAAERAVGSGVLVGIGGDIAVAGPAPAEGWPVRIAADHAAPLTAGGPTVSISTGGLATSSTTVRRWRAGTRELQHLFDPRTGEPVESPWRTVSVAAASCVDANTASTAAFVLGADAPSWLDERNLPARLERADGEVALVAGWPEDES